MRRTRVSWGGGSFWVKEEKKEDEWIKERIDKYQTCKGLNPTEESKGEPRRSVGSEVNMSVHGGSAIPVEGGRGEGTDWERVFLDSHSA